MAPERQRHVLLGLAAALVVVGTWRYLDAVNPAAPAAVAAARRVDPAVAPITPVDVQLEALSGARDGPEVEARNPFVFGMRAVSASGPTRPRSTGSTGPVPPIVPALPAGPPPLPPIPFKFIGLVEGASGARRIAVLSDSKGLVVHGTDGAIIDGRFRILSIGAESIEIAYADGRGRQTLRLSGQ